MHYIVKKKVVSPLNQFESLLLTTMISVKLKQKIINIELKISTRFIFSICGGFADYTIKHISGVINMYQS